MKTKLRKVVMLALVLVLLISNTVGANASTGEPTTVVDSYGALFSATVIKGANFLQMRALGEL